MTPFRMITRRVAIADLGKAGLAVVVFGGAACAGESQDGLEPSTTAPPTTSAPTTDGPTTTSPPPETTEAEGPVSATSFERVNLGFVSAYILYRGGEAVLVDTGVSGSAGSIEASLTGVGLDWTAVGQVILTHKHPDHQGSLPGVIAAAGGLDIYAGAADIPNIDTDAPITPVDDGDKVFDLDIIATPGHTPGHISVLDPVGGILVAGDALRGGNGGVVAADPNFSEDMALADASVVKLAGFDYEVALFGHGEPLLTGASAAIGDLATSL